MRHTSLAQCLPLRPAGSEAPIGLLAGAGRYPVVFAEKARACGIPVVCVGIRHMAPPELPGLVERYYSVTVAQIGRAIRAFKKEGVERLVMAGKVTKAVIHTPWRILTLMPDWRTIKFWYNRRRRDNRDDTLLLGIIDEFARDGLHFSTALELCPELLVKTGVLTRRAPTSGELADIAFGWEIAKEMGRLDVGQSIAVKERAVLAVEAIEGTDKAIARAGEYCRAGGFVVVKVAKPQQDMRFDVPTVGCSTIETLHGAGGTALGIEADRTIVIDHDETVALANRYGIAITALTA